MRLNKSHKDQIYSAIVKDIPKINSNDLYNQINHEIYKGMSEECRTLFLKNPFSLHKIYPSNLGLEYHHQNFIVGDANFRTILKPFVKAETKRVNALNNLKHAINSCKTRQEFINRFPELSIYAPKEISRVSKNIPAVANVVSDLISIGFVPKVTKPE